MSSINLNNQKYKWAIKRIHGTMTVSDSSVTQMQSQQLIKGTASSDLATTLVCSLKMYAAITVLRVIITDAMDSVALVVTTALVGTATFGALRTQASIPTLP